MVCNKPITCLIYVCNIKFVKIETFILVYQVKIKYDLNTTVRTVKKNYM